MQNANQMHIPLHNYQIYAKNFVLSHPFCGLFLKMGLGKAIDDDTIIPTPDGEKRVGDIMPGDRIFGKDGKPHTVQAIYPHKNEPAYKITLEDGRTFICSHEHLIAYQTGRSRRINIGTADDIKRLLAEKKSVRIPLCEPVEYEAQPHVIQPEDVGIALGKPTLDACPAFGPDMNQLSIPKEYLIDSVENRFELLEGIVRKGYGYRHTHKHRLDTFKGWRPTVFSTFATESKQLANDVITLCESLGIYAAILPTFQFNGDHTETYVIRIAYDFLEKKTTRNTAKVLYMTGQPATDMTCFTVDSPDSLFLINDYIVTHNTSIVLEALWEMNPANHVLIIAPKNIARCTWVNEIEKWNMGLRTQSLVVNERGKQLTKKKREEIYASIPTAPPTVYFINRELLGDLEAHFPADRGRWPFPTVIIDESQSFKSYNSNRFKTMKKIRPFLKQLILLTGSPTPNGIEDIWPQIYMLDMGYRLGKNITEFRDNYCMPGHIKTPSGYPVNWYPRPGAEKFIYNRISDIVISMENKYIQLPPITFNDVPVYMAPEEYAKYKKLMKTNVLELTGGAEIEAANAAVLSAKLSQMASGSIYTGEKKYEYELIHEHKLEMCEYIVNNAGGNVIIAYHFVSEAVMLKKYFKEHDIPIVEFDGSPQMEQDWNQKKIPVMLLQPASCGFGLNLQHGGSTLIWYTLPWSLEQYEQTNARIYRQGQAEPVIVHRLLTDNTIDTHILDALSKKDMSQQRLLKAVEAVVKD